jgi:GDP-4-dehydro-6-deoxy-D-mannose reductase
MRVLVTGAAGFAGRHLMAEIRASGHEALGFDLPPSAPLSAGSPHYAGDVRDLRQIESVLAETQPDACIHLAGIAFVPTGWTEPQLVFSVNTMGTLNVLEAVRKCCAATRLVMVTSAEIYGASMDDRPISEETPTHPESLYAVSKLAADQMALLYAKRYGMAVLTARPANHIGPGQAPEFVCSSFAKQLAEIRAGLRSNILNVGNLDSERCFLDVRDVARAYRLLAERGQPGKAYNIASSDRIPVKTVLDILCEEAGLSPERRMLPELYRPTDRSALFDTSRIRKDVGWQPAIPLRQTLRDILDDWARRVKTGAGGAAATP